MTRAPSSSQAIIAENLHRSPANISPSPHNRLDKSILSTDQSYVSARSATDGHQLLTSIASTRSGDVRSASGLGGQMASQPVPAPSSPDSQIPHPAAPRDHPADEATTVDYPADSVDALWQGIFDPQEYYRFSATTGLATEDPFSIVDFPWFANEDMFI